MRGTHLTGSSSSDFSWCSSLLGASASDGAMLRVETGLLPLQCRLIGVHFFNASHILSIGVWVLRYLVVA